jgi:two-component system phosphate regulon sensor histidine kinase PhoR
VKIDSLSTRIFLALSGLLAVLLAGAGVFGSLRAQETQRDELEGELERAARALAEPAADVLSGRAAREALHQRMVDLGQAAGMRVTLVAADGAVVLDSEAPGPWTDHSDRPEILAAARDGQGVGWRRSATTGKESFYLARRIEEQGRLLGWVRAAVESDRLFEGPARFRTSLLLFGAVVLVLGAIAALFLARWLARPLEYLLQDAAELSKGRLDVEVRTDGPREVRRLAEGLNAMSRQLRERIEGMRRERSEVATILASMQEGVVAVDSAERVLVMNRAAAELLALRAPLEAGADLWRHVRFPEMESALRTVIAGEQSAHCDAPSPRQDGRVLGLSVARFANQRAGDEPISGAVVLLADVTAIRRLEQMRIDFVANVSHELRTPLAAVMGALETLGDPEQDAATRARFLDIADRNAARLHAIVSDLLDLSAIESEGERMVAEAVRIDAPLRTAASALSGAAESKGVRLDLPGPLPQQAWVRGSSQRLEQVFTNLLENAIKYTPAGGRVSARVRVAPGEVSVDVEDTGVGIPPASLPRIFERFYRVDRSRSREMGGTGLGLAIVKHVVRAHGGQVVVRSEEGHGTTFTVTLPRTPSSDKS